MSGHESRHRDASATSLAPCESASGLIVVLSKVLRMKAGQRTFRFKPSLMCLAFPCSITCNVVGIDDDDMVDERIWNHSLRNIDRLVELRGMISTILSDVDFCTS